MYEKLIYIGDDYWIEDESEMKFFFVDGKFLRLHNIPCSQRYTGNDLYKIHERFLKLRDTIDIKQCDDGLQQQLKNHSLTFYEIITYNS